MRGRAGRIQKSGILLAAALCMLTFTDAPAQVYKMPVPPECSSSKKLTLPRGNHPDDFRSYGKVDLYCGTRVVAKGATLCNSDYDRNKPLQKTINIAVSSAVRSGKASACPAGTDLRIVAE